MSYKDKDLKILWSKSGGICAFPGCNQELICNNTQDIIGQICHIIAKKPDGPRGDSNYSKEELNSYSNLILLCPTHHSIIDNNVDTYTTDKLIKMKEEHESIMLSKIKSKESWKVNVAQLYYVNIPRIAILAGINGIEFDFKELSYTNCLHSMGWSLNYLLIKIQNLINLLSINSNMLDDNIDKLALGQLIEFNHKFRTKNVPYPQKVKSGEYFLTGNIDKDPQIYFKNKSYKFILSIDPRWITTSTSYCNLTSGWIDAAGLCMIKSIDYHNKIIIATPYIIGIPKSLYDFIF
ncbi:hypothetical protein CLPU_3c00670 [Gottschalkia purinilytica]|uniref:HNH nuclease domain-containing protein n=1 Tax=Gottschalkia purinilytica TaxID=1503 RepID=A0A0L0WCT5_GOTPU|nr:HNH endonuclease signature motif containing protein [Gottschalkia purinilytica]KNF09289.1 hypothetical protein CLPU_3c00670 [Gottschalkia purinilytica]